MGELWKALGRIPEVTYDLMSRIVPGGIVLAAVVASSGLQLAWGKLEITVFLVLSYPVGLGVSAIATVVCNIAFWVSIGRFVCCDAYKRIAKSLNETVTGCPSWKPWIAMRLLGRAHDRMGVSDEGKKDKRSIGTKLFAEVALLYSMGGALAIAALLNPSTGVFLGVCCGGFVVAGAFRSWRTWERFANLVERS